MSKFVHEELVNGSKARVIEIEVTGQKKYSVSVLPLSPSKEPAPAEAARPAPEPMGFDTLGEALAYLRSLRKS